MTDDQTHNVARLMRC